MKKGFSFIGVLIATFITAIGLIALFSLANMSFKGGEIGRMRMIASGLAQEGIEIVRDIRASNLEWSGWAWYSTTTPLVYPIGSSYDYCPQYNSESLSLCSPSAVPLKLDVSTALYQYSSGDPTPFYRKVTLTRLSNDEVKVVVEVKWKMRQGNDWHYFIAEDRLWKWR